MSTPTPILTSLGRLLIVDDEIQLMTALCEMLEVQGYEVSGFSSGTEALEALKARDFDLLLTDLMMPDMDGISLLRAGLELDPNLVGIIMTGQGTIQTTIEAMKLGAFDYVLKPFKLNELRLVLSRAMEVRKLKMENVQLRETVAIYELSQAMASSLDLNVILNKIVEAAIQQCEAEEASVMLPTPDGNELYLAAIVGENRKPLLGQKVPIDCGIAGWVARHREPLTLYGEINDPRFTPIKARSEIQAAISIPMLAAGKLVGVLNVNALRRRRPFTLGQAKTLNILASMFTSMLENVQLYMQLQKANEELEFRVIERTRELAAVNKELETFAYSVSHDLRAPLRNINGFSQALMEDYADRLEAQGKVFLKHICNSTQRMGQLIDDLLTLSRVTRGEMRRENVDLSAMAQQIAAELQNTQAQAERQVEFSIAEGIVADGDARLLRLALENLLSNAWKFTSKRPNAEIEFGIIQLSHEDQATYLVRDNGTGFDMSYSDKLFVPFQRLHSTSEFPGTGVGLATVQRIIQRHGGQIWAESQPDQGATFYFTLPN